MTNNYPLYRRLLIYIKNGFNKYNKYVRDKTYIDICDYTNPIYEHLKKGYDNCSNGAFAGYVAFMAHYHRYNNVCDCNAHADIKWINDNCGHYASSVVDMLLNRGMVSENSNNPEIESTFHKVNNVYVTTSYDDLIHAILEGYVVIGTVDTCDKSNTLCIVAGCLIKDGMIGCPVPWSCKDIIWITRDYIRNNSYVWYIVD